MSPVGETTINITATGGGTTDPGTGDNTGGGTTDPNPSTGGDNTGGDNTGGGTDPDHDPWGGTNSDE